MLKSLVYRRFAYEKAIYGHSGRCPYYQRGGLRKKNRAETPAEPEDLQENVIHITPNQNGASDGLETSWLDEPETIQTDLEEIVSCTYTLPHLTLGTSDASAAANTVFDDLSQTVISYAQETVYPAAQEKGAIGYVNGGYSISEEDGAIVVNYTISVSYSTENGDQQFKHLYTIDLTTGELLKEE